MQLDINAIEILRTIADYETKFGQAATDAGSACAYVMQNPRNKGVDPASWQKKYFALKGPLSLPAQGLVTAAGKGRRGSTLWALTPAGRAVLSYENKAGTAARSSTPAPTAALPASRGPLSIDVILSRLPVDFEREEFRLALGDHISSREAASGVIKWATVQEILEFALEYTEEELVALGLDPAKMKGRSFRFQESD